MSEQTVEQISNSDTEYNPSPDRLADGESCLIETENGHIRMVARNDNLGGWCLSLSNGFAPNGKIEPGEVTVAFIRACKRRGGGMRTQFLGDAARLPDSVTGEEMDASDPNWWRETMEKYVQKYLSLGEETGQSSFEQLYEAVFGDENNVEL